jgi:16S rRNA (cytidine1402-2'-O)-methyltransferase
VEFTVSNQSGVLYVVATPIGNLEDISERARRILAEVDLVAAEDTRHSKKLLTHLDVSTPMRAYHDHNEHRVSASIIEMLLQGKNIALISDAGTPLIHDPGYELVQQAHQESIKVVPIPGPSALISALSVAGLSSDRFIFEGFVPEKQVARRKHLQSLSAEIRTLVFYEAPHRIKAFIDDSVMAFGKDRQACLARELSKLYETVNQDTLGNLQLWLSEDEVQSKGEFVVVIRGAENVPNCDESEATRIMQILLQSVSLKQAAAMGAEISGLKKNDLYKLALDLKK